MMQTFEYIRAEDVASAVALVSSDPRAQYLAGGTTQIDLMLKDGVLAPRRSWAIWPRSAGTFSRPSATCKVVLITYPGSKR